MVARSGTSTDPGIVKRLARFHAVRMPKIEHGTESGKAARGKQEAGKSDPAQGKLKPRLNF